MTTALKKSPQVEKQGNSGVQMPDTEEFNSPPPLKVATQDKANALQNALYALQPDNMYALIIPKKTMEKFINEEKEHEKMAGLMEHLQQFSLAIQARANHYGHTNDANENKIVESNKEAFNHYVSLVKEMIEQQVENLDKNQGAISKFRQKIELIEDVVTNGTKMLLAPKGSEAEREHALALKQAIKKKRDGIEGSALFRPNNKKYHYAASALLVAVSLVLLAYAPAATAVIALVAGIHAYRTYKKSASDEQKASANAAAHMDNAHQIALKS